MNPLLVRSPETATPESERCPREEEVRRGLAGAHRVVNLRPGECCEGILRGRGEPAQGCPTWIVESTEDHAIRLRLRSDSPLLDQRLSQLRDTLVRIHRRRDLRIDGRIVPDYAVT